MDLFSSVLSILNITPPTGRASFNVDCPHCGGRKKLNINITKGVFNCPRCSTGGGAVPLYALFKYGIEPISIKNDDNLRKKMYAEINGNASGDSFVSRKVTLEKIQEERLDVDPADISFRNSVYTDFLNLLTLNPAHHEHLIKNRGLSENSIIMHGYKSTPDTSEIPTIIKKLLEKYPDGFAGVPGFYINKGKWTVCRVSSGIFIPCRDQNGQIEGMQIRFDNPKDKAKYKWLSSPNMEKGCSACTWSHFVGYPEESVYLTEGILKADIINNFLDVPVIGIPGVNTISRLEPLLKYLQSVGVTTIITAFDMDYLSNEFVFKAYNRLLEYLAQFNFKVIPKKWDPQYKGLDDFLFHEYQNKGK